ncbi:uncharacterized protein LOC134693796 [Mytilus trossulus]|uniref:uncharacterized protein LOC134693796 n=1 Tax=Mytilus trossulus TaxID=6551 RepID=UPI0030072078
MNNSPDSDQDREEVSHRTEATGIYIGNTEPTSIADLEQLCAIANSLREEKYDLENKNDELQHQTLTLKRENNDARRKIRELEDAVETENERHERGTRELQSQCDERINDMYDTLHKQRLQIEHKDELIRSMTKEMTTMKTRLMTYENDHMRDIRPRQSKRFKRSMIPECKHCHSAITDGNEECCFHPEKPVRAVNYSKTNPVMLWKCCYQVAKKEPFGCTSHSNHEPVV